MSDERTGLTQGETYRSAEAWAWAHERSDADPEHTIDPASVCAVMVTHEAGEWLPRQLLSLAALEPRPGTIVVVDTGSTDDTVPLLHRARDEGVVSAVIEAPSNVGFGAAVALGVETLEEPAWLWLLHDDSAPKRRALAELVRCAAERDADVLVPKLLLPKRRNYPDQVLEVGRSIAPDGRQVLSVEPGDIDQHQLDSEPTLGASTAGLFVRGSVWRTLGGFDPDIPLFRDGVEFGWRANEQGFTVLTCPQAALYHRQAGRLEYRSSELAPHPQVSDRLAAMRLVAARAERPGRTMARLWLIGILRAIGFLLGKSPGQARDELRALRELQATPDVTAAIRQRIAAQRPDASSSVTGLRPAAFAGVRHIFDRLAGVVVERYRDLISSESDTSIDELTGDDFAGGHARRRIVLAPVAVLSLVLLVVGIVASRSYVGPGSLEGGGLLAAPATLADAWSAFLSPTPGVPGTSPLWLGVMALGSTLTLGQPAWFVLALMVLAPLFAAWAAHGLVRALVESAWLRALIAGLWGAGVWVLGFVGAGSLSGIALAISLPMFVRSVLRWRSRPPEGAERWRGPAATAGWLTVLAAAYPVTWLLALPAAAWWAIKERERIVEILVAVLGPVVLCAGWLPALVSHPGRLLTGTDPLAAGDVVPGGMLLVGAINAGAPHAAVSIVFFCSLIAVAGWLVLTKVTGPARWAIFGAVAAGYGVAAALSRIVVGVNGGTVRPELEFWLLIVLCALLAPLVSLDTEADARLSRRLPALLVAASLVFALVWVAVAGVSGPVSKSATRLPQYVTVVQDSARKTRTIMIELTGTTAHWSLVAAEQPRWGTGERNLISPDAELTARLTAIAQSVARGRLGDDAAGQLGSLGVGHIWLRGASAEQVAAISNAAGLTRAAADEVSQLWTVTGLVSRARIVSGETTQPLTTDELPPGAEGRTLVLAEPNDSRWVVRVNGRAIPSSEGATPTFALPAEGGSISWSMAPATGYLVLQVITIGLLIVLAAPVVGAAKQARRVKED